MLVLSRKKDEKINLIVTDEQGHVTRIVLQVVETGATKTRLGIEAPPNVRILRSEFEVATVTKE